MTLSNADKLRFAEVEDRITREFGDSDTMDFLEYLKQQDVENGLRRIKQDLLEESQNRLEESIEFLVNECGELQKEVNEYRQQEDLNAELRAEITNLKLDILDWIEITNKLESEIVDLEHTIARSDELEEEYW